MAIGFGEAADLNIETTKSFVETVNNRCIGANVQGPEISTKARVRLVLLTELPVIRFPFRASGQVGRDPSGFGPKRSKHFGRRFASAPCSRHKAASIK
jgi:hypothetical protein